MSKHILSDCSNLIKVENCLPDTKIREKNFKFHSECACEEVNDTSSIENTMKFLTEEIVKEIWRNTDCVCFDVDSTVCKNEAIDDLADFLNVGAQVQKLTKEAMGGNMTFREALRVRLNIIKPPLKVIDEFNKTQKHLLTPKIEDLINMLHKLNIPVYLVSGGFRIIINPVADRLNIDRRNVYANTIQFDSLGEYAGFDENEFTSETGGKGKAIDFLKAKHGYKNVVMIGDGATDLESCPPADAFIGFGGNVVREKVKQNSGWFVYDFQELINELKPE